MNPLALSRYLRLAPFDTTTAQGREAERYRRVMLTVLANAMSKGLAMVVMVLGVALTLPYLGAERFGMWATVAGFAGLLAVLDLGVGNALTNHVAERASTRDVPSVRQAISGGLGVLLLLGTFVAIALCLVASAIPWDRVMLLRDPVLIVEARQTGMLFAILFGLSLFTNGIHRIFAGLQRGFESHLVSALGSLLAAVGIWCAAEAQAGISVLLAITLGSQIGSSLLLMILLTRRDLLSRRGLPNAIRREAPLLFRTGGLFFILQIGIMVGWGSDGLIISSTLGAAQVAVYGVTQRLFQFVVQPLAVLNAPLWAAYADAHVRGDKAFVTRTFKRSMLLTAGVATGGVCALAALSQWLLAQWTGGTVEIPPAFIYMFAIWTVLEAIGNAFAMFLNGSFIVRQQVIVVLVFTLAALPMKILGVQMLGIIAIPLISAGVYLIVTVGFYGVLFRPRLRAVLAEGRSGG